MSLSTIKSSTVSRARWAVNQVKTTASAARAIVTKREAPLWARITLVVCLAYLAMPIDLIPDFIPFLGWADDALVVLLMLWVIRRANR